MNRAFWRGDTKKEPLQVRFKRQASKRACPSFACLPTIHSPACLSSKPHQRSIIWVHSAVEGVWSDLPGQGVDGRLQAPHGGGEEAGPPHTRDQAGTLLLRQAVARELLLPAQWGPHLQHAHRGLLSSHPSGFYLQQREAGGFRSSAAFCEGWREAASDLDTGQRNHKTRRARMEWIRLPPP